MGRRLHFQGLASSIVFLYISLPSQAADIYQISTISNRPDKISGGDALVRIDVPDDVLIGDIRIKLNGKAVTAIFRPGQMAHSYIGLVRGLNPGNNTLELFRSGGAGPAAQLVLTNHPLTGPVFSGPQEHPFICQTDNYVLPDGALLGTPLDSNCSVKTVVTYVYRSAATESGNPSLKPLPSLTDRPPDVLWTTTSTGQRVPYIVRVETGTINRAIYQIAVLHDPVADHEPSPFAPSKGWNQRLLYSFGGGCTGGWFRQGATMGLSLTSAAPGTLTDFILRKGYASASSSLNVFGNNCQDVTASETMMMVKEHFIETYGKPLFTFGRGGSGGSYQQNQTADNYPGLLDGIIPSATFPDVLATIQFLSDAQLLDRYFASRSSTLTNEQKRVVAGVGVLPNVTRTARGAGRINPTVFCPPELPVSLRYDARINPTGARCDVFDHTVNVYGRDPATGFARRPIDNIGVQYGLAALNSGKITPSQFLDLNERIGGYDDDGNMVAKRSSADPVALRAAYRTGRLTHGGGGLATVPIIDLRHYADLTSNGDLHLKYHSFAFRERLRKANGTTTNHVMLVYGPTRSLSMEEYTITKMDEWLTSLTADTTDERPVDKIAAAKPEDLVDSCYSPSGQRIVEPQTFSGGECNKLYPTFPSPRMIAGGPVTNDVLKCQLKPVDFKDYRVNFAGAEKVRLRAIFPHGVCDWTKPGVEKRQPLRTWLSF